MATRETTIAKVKKDLRISHTSLDDDLNDQISACLADLEICGIVDPDEADPIILAAIKNWCRREYISDVNRSQAYGAAYDAQKGCLMMAEGYGGKPREEAAEADV